MLISGGLHQEGYIAQVSVNIRRGYIAQVSVNIRRGLHKHRLVLISGGAT